MEFKTSDITTSEIWDVVASQWERGEGRSVLRDLAQKAENEKRMAESAKTQKQTTLSDIDDNFSHGIAELSLDDEERSPEEAIYFEKSSLPNGLTFTAFSKNLPTQSSPCANMVSVDKNVRRNTAYFFRSEEDFSLLVGLNDTPYLDSVFGKEMDIPASHASNAQMEYAHRLSLSHPAIRKGITSLELGIYLPHVNDFWLHKRTGLEMEALMAERKTELKKQLSSLAGDLASFEKLRFIRIVLMAWGRGSQTFKKDGLGADCVLPFCDLLDSGIYLGIQLQIWGSIRIPEVGSGLRVGDTRRGMNDTEACDFQEQFDARRFELGMEDMELEYKVDNKTSIIRCLAGGNESKHGYRN